VLRCAVDGKYRTRLCQHWDGSKGVSCPMRKKVRKCHMWIMPCVWMSRVNVF
jgi:hypothetical protein